MNEADEAERARVAAHWKEIARRVRAAGQTPAITPDGAKHLFDVFGIRIEEYGFVVHEPDASDPDSEELLVCNRVSAGFNRWVSAEDLEFGNCTWCSSPIYWDKHETRIARRACTQCATRELNL